MAKVVLRPEVAFKDLEITKENIVIGAEVKDEKVSIHVFHDSGGYSVVSFNRPKGVSSRGNAHLLGHREINTSDDFNSAPRLSTVPYIGKSVNLAEVPVYSGDDTKSGRVPPKKVRFLIFVEFGKVGGYYEFDWDGKLVMHDVVYERGHETPRVRLTPFGYFSYYIAKFGPRPKEYRGGKSMLTAMIYLNDKLIGRLNDDYTRQYSISDYAIVGTTLYYKLYRKYQDHVDYSTVMAAAIGKYIAYVKYNNYIVEYNVIDALSVSDSVLFQDLKSVSYFRGKKAEITGTEREIYGDAILGYDARHHDLYTLETKGMKKILHRYGRNPKDVDYIATATWDNVHDIILFTKEENPTVVITLTGWKN